VNARLVDFDDFARLARDEALEVGCQHLECPEPLLEPQPGVGSRPGIEGTDLVPDVPLAGFPHDALIVPSDLFGVGCLFVLLCHE